MTSDNHAEIINEQYESGARQERQETPKRQRMAKVIQDLLAQAELASKRNDETARDEALAKAAALQLKFAIDDAMLAAGAEGKDELAQADFCTESNTPLIKAKRELINGVAQFNRGKAVMMGQWKPKKGGGRRYDRRAKVTVFAHQSDLDFITMLYNSLILQMQTMMAADENHERRYGYPPAAGWQAWRVSYAYGWVRRVVGRIAEAKRHNEAQAEADTPGTALVLRDRDAIVQAHITDLFGKLKDAKYRIDDNSADGHAAGRRAAERADLGQTKVNGSRTRAIEA